MEKVWFQNYPEGSPTTLDTSKYDSILDILDKAIREHPDRPAYINMGQVLTFRKLEERSRAFAAYLQNELKLERGERVALMMPNLLQYPIALFGILRAGLVVVNVNPLYTPRELEHQLQDSGATAIVVVSNFASTLEKIVFNTKVKHVILTRMGDQLSFGKRNLVNFVVKYVKKLVPKYKLPNAVTFREVLSIGKFRQYVRPQVDREDLAFLQYTGGTTGVAKGAMLTHGNIITNIFQAKWIAEPFIGDHAKQRVAVLALPLYHVSGQGIVWRWLYAGATLVLPKEDFYQSIGYVSHVSLVPTQLQRWFDYLIEHPQSTQTQAVLLGGTQIPVKLTQALNELGIRSYSGYGMTEMASTVFAKQSDGKVGVGQPLLGRAFKLVNEEVWLKGAGLAMGYWREGHIVPLTNAEGWFQTKDKAQWLDDELVIQGRLDNMFISGGENIQPEEIEKVIAQSDLVKQVFVLPQHDEEFGHRPVAIVEFHTSFNESAVESLNVFLQGRLERFKQPVAYYELPQDLIQGAIKISRKALADWLLQQ